MGLAARCLLVLFAAWGVVVTAGAVWLLARRDPGVEARQTEVIQSLLEENAKLQSDVEASHREALIAQGFAPAPLVIDGGVITCKLTSRDTVKANGQTFRIPEGDGAIVVDSAAGTIVRDPSLRPEECE